MSGSTYTFIQTYILINFSVMAMLSICIGLQVDTFNKAHGMVYLRFVNFIAWKFHPKRKKKVLNSLICVECLEVEHTGVCNSCLIQKI